MAVASSPEVHAEPLFAAADLAQAEGRPYETAEDLPKRVADTGVTDATPRRTRPNVNGSTEASSGKARPTRSKGA
jgi:hypothetical protein